jgi:hypothetical protein
MNCDEFNAASDYVSELEHLLLDSGKVNDVEFTKVKLDYVANHGYLKTEELRAAYLDDWCAYVSDLIVKYEIELK